MEKFLKLILRHRMLVLSCMLGIIVLGIIQYRKLPTDAFPDISPIMVPVFAEAHGLAPEEIERLITFPIESEMNGLPGVREVKSTSAFGLAVVYVYFKDNVELYFARQLVAERLASAELLETDERPVLGPISTGLGEVFMYYLWADPETDMGGKDRDLFLREVNDWIVKFELRTVTGVTEILSMGGHVLQYQISLKPSALYKYNLTPGDIMAAVTSNNRNAGGQYIVLGSEEYLVRGIGLLETLGDLQNIHVKSENGVPVRLSDVADVVYGREIRRGVVTHNGTEEIVAGIVMKLYGQNTSEVIKRLEKKIPEVQRSLPKGVRLVPYYNQSSLVRNAVITVQNALWQGGLLVILVLVLFLGNARSACIVALALPTCALVAVICMGAAGMSANLMSLGGIAVAIGMLGDASIVMVENIFRHMGERKNRAGNKQTIILSAAKEVARPVIFSVAIIVMVFIPIFTLEGTEGKMFGPMAFTISFALLGSLLSALTFSPVLSSFLLAPGIQKEFVLIAFLKRVYGRTLRSVLRRRTATLAGASAVFVLSLILLPRLGTEFIPVLEEGVIQVNVTLTPSISLEKAADTVMRLERRIRTFDGVEETIAKIGRPETGSHPHPVNSAHIQVKLKRAKEWKNHHSKAELVESIRDDLSAYPGVQLAFSQPIQNMFDELLSGVKTQLAIKIYGDNLEVLRVKAEEVRDAISPIRGLVDLSTEQSFGQPQLQIVADREACGRYGVNVSDILEVVEVAVGGKTVDQVYLGSRRFGIHVRFSERDRNSADRIGRILVHASDGSAVPLSQVAQIRTVTGPVQISREGNQRRWIGSANIRGRDMGGVVSDIRRQVESSVTLPSGYHIEYGGQFENQQRAMKRLSVIVPAVLVMIFLSLTVSLGSIRSAALIMVNVPLAMTGGILGLLFIREYLSVPASVGFIALFGIAVQNGLVLVTCINQLRAEGLPAAKAVTEACLVRLRPVLMTAVTTILGLVPLLFSRGMGSEVQRPLAVVVVFGLASSTFLTLLLIPALYEWFEHRR